MAVPQSLKYLRGLPVAIRVWEIEGLELIGYDPKRGPSLQPSSPTFRRGPWRTSGG
jgi:hypothetical protein